MTEWLRWLPAKQLGYARAGSNPAGVVIRVQQSTLFLRDLRKFHNIYR